jgi:hypothetical protein
MKKSILCFIFVAPQEEFSLWQNFQRLSGEKSNEAAEKILSNQVDSYLSLPTLGMNEDPCKWWKENCQIYNYLAPLARVYLGVPATEVESERVFSSAGNVVNERRRSLRQENISELVFLHHNL